MQAFNDPVSNPAFIIDLTAGVLAIPSSSCLRSLGSGPLLTSSLIFVIGNVLCGCFTVPNHNLATYLRSGQSIIN